MPSLAHRAEYAALRGAVALLDRLPWRAALGFGARLGALGYRPFAIRRRVVERQVAAAMPELDAREVRRIARGAYEHLGRTTIEVALLPGLGPEGVLALFEGVDGWEHVERAMIAKKGILFVTGHLGNWELAGSYVASRGIPLDAVVRRQTNPMFDRWLNETRARIGMHVVPDSEAVRRIPRSLKQGRAIALVADQGVKGLASTFVPFFGRPAKTPRGPAVFALRFDAPILFATALRQPGGKYRFFIEPVPVVRTGDTERDVDETVAAYTRVIEDFVRRYPEQYLWQHRRWRRQPEDTPAHLREPA
ncbi:MAG TPA: lysophospholipid acyltransferase family protein [Gemmatimonadaceae bacterium]